MFVDGRSVPSGSSVEADVCVIGGGAAGIALARELTGTGPKVVVLESGAFEYEQATQSLYDGASTGIPMSPSVSRLRYLGGSTNHWGGWCRPLDPLDFRVRAWVPNSGWPLTLEQLRPYYERAQRICQLGPYEYDTQHWADGRRPQLDLPGDLLRSVIYQFSPPTRFGTAYRDELDRAANVSVYLHSNAQEIVLNGNLSDVERVEVATLSGRRFQVRTRFVVLGVGGIENARLLLASNRQQKAGLGNQNDLVGRYFMDHPHVTVDTIAWSRMAVNLNLYRWQNDYLGYVRKAWDRLLRELGSWPPVVRAGLAPTEAAQRDLGILNIGLTFDPPSRAPAKAPKPDETRDTLAWLVSATEYADRPESAALPLMMRGEQLPDPDSRVSLASDRDALGMRRVSVDWRLGEAEKRTIVAMTMLLGRALSGGGLASLAVNPWILDEAWLHNADAPWDNVDGIGHHMGTTRMDPDPARGVVDTDCKVHGISNLYVAGGSVFRTCGFANPTLTLLALTYRLADHLRGRLARA